MIFECFRLVSLLTSKTLCKKLVPPFISGQAESFTLQQDEDVWWERAGSFKHNTLS